MRSLTSTLKRRTIYRELLILTTDNHDGAIVQIKGKLRPDDIDAAIEKGTKNNKLKKCKLWDKHA